MSFLNFKNMFECVTEVNDEHYSLLHIGIHDFERYPVPKMTRINGFLLSVDYN